MVTAEFSWKLRGWILHQMTQLPLKFTHFPGITWVTAEFSWKLRGWILHQMTQLPLKFTHFPGITWVILTACPPLLQSNE